MKGVSAKISFPCQLNIRLAGGMRDELQEEARRVHSTPSQIAREAISREMKRRKARRERARPSS